MEFKVVLTLENSARNKSDLINDLFNNINDFVANRKYGEGIYQYLISLYIINPPKGYEYLHKNLKPKYTDHKLINNRFTGGELEIKKQFHYSIRVDGEMYDTFIGASEEESKKLLATEILNSLSYLDKLPKKIKDFDKNKFKADIKNFFKDQELI